jgi:hypothetical protein
MRRMRWLIVPAALMLVVGTVWAQRPEVAAPEFEMPTIANDEGTVGGRGAPDIYVDDDDPNCVSAPQADPYSVVYCTIQDAISDAAPDDIIHVAAGTYVEVGQIVINKDLTIVGDPADRPLIKPNQNTGDPNSGNARGWFLVTAGNSLTLRHAILDGVGKQICIAVLSFGTVTIEDCVIKNIGWSAASYYGRGVCIYASTGNVVRGCEFSSITRIGVFAFYDGTEVTIDHCTYTGKGSIDCLDYGFELGGGAVGTVTNNTVTNCKGVASSDGSTSAGVLITTYYGSGTAGDLFGNVITDNTCGIGAGYDSNDTSDVVAHYNDVSGNDNEGIDNTSSTKTVDAEKNWWGTTDLTAIAAMVGGLVDYDPPLLTNRIRMAFGGNRLVDLQNNDGGWDWPLDDGDPNNASPQNTIGPIGMGLAKAYRATSDPPGMVDALQNVSAFLLAKTNTFSPPDGYLAAELDDMLGGTTHADHLNTYFYGPLASGTYDRNGAGTLYSTASYIQLIHDARHGGGIGNLAAWDIGMGLVGAASCGVSGSELDLWIQGVEDEIDLLDGDESYDVLGLAGAVYGLAFVNEDFDPTAGEHAAASSLSDLADILVSYQIAESGGFAWNSNYVIPYDYNETIQETAYASLALDEMGGYASEVASAAQYMLSVQLPTGGWENYVGSTGGENNEVSAEALWGLWAAAHTGLTLEPDADCYHYGATVTVEIWMRDIAQTIYGGQFFLEYDNTVLDFASADPAGTIFTLEVSENVDENAGTIDYATGIPHGGSGTSGNAQMAVLTFTALGEVCSVEDLITWRPHNPPSRLTNDMGGPVYPEKLDLPVITIDSTPPVLENPDNVTIECDDPRIPTGVEPEPWNHKMHYPQLPDPYGWDVFATAPAVLADDWLCTGDGPVADIHFWGSWVDDVVGNITSIRVSIHADVPDPDGDGPLFSMPGALEWERVFYPGEFAVTEIDPDTYDPPASQGWYEPPGYWEYPDHHMFFRYDIQNIPGPFVQTAGEIYWLDISVTVDTGWWGWKTTQSHWNDDAVYWDSVEYEWKELYNPLEPYESLDLAFVITAGGELPDPFVGYGYAHDNCDPDPAVTYWDDVDLTGCNGTGTITRTWTAIDYCGNFSTCVQTITVVDNTPPVITCPDAVTVECPSDVPPAATDYATFVALGGAASDNCGPVTVTHQGDSSDNNACPETITRTYRATDACGLWAECDQLITVDDTIPPVVTCPADIDVNADAGGCTGQVTWPPATADDNCDGDLSGLVVYDIDEGNDGSIEVSDYASTTYTFPGGTHKVTAKAEDSCLNTGSCDFFVTVSDKNELVVDIDLQATVAAGPFTRCITFVLWDCGPDTSQTVEQVVTFTNGAASTVTVLVPCGAYDCITAKDKLHTLRQTDDGLTTGGTEPVQYLADFTVTGGDELIGGDLNDDGWIDILDFGVFSWQYGTNYGTGDTDCNTPYPHADIDGDGLVDTADFTFIQINFLDGDEDNCCGAPGPLAGPRTSISLDELEKLGLSELAVGDLNHDGWLDEADIEAFMQGARPKTPAQTPGNGANQVDSTLVRPRP